MHGTCIKTKLNKLSVTCKQGNRTACTSFFIFGKVIIRWAENRTAWTEIKLPQTFNANFDENICSLVTMKWTFNIYVLNK